MGFGIALGCVLLRVRKGSLGASVALGDGFRGQKGSLRAVAE